MIETRKINKRITLNTLEKVTDEYGSSTTIISSQKLMWAEIREAQPNPGSRDTNYGINDFSLQYRIKFRWLGTSKLSASDLSVEYGEKTYEVLGINSDIGFNHTEVELFVKEAKNG